MLRILPFMEPYSAALNKAVLLVKLGYEPACVVVGITEVLSLKLHL